MMPPEAASKHVAEVYNLKTHGQKTNTLDNYILLLYVPDLYA
jgi:hypothetical protein